VGNVSQPTMTVYSPKETNTGAAIVVFPGGGYQVLAALQDAQRTVGLVRFHAAEWHIDPHRIGVLGFSAGGHLSAAISTHFKQRLYRPWTRLTRNAAGRILRWLSIRSI